MRTRILVIAALAVAVWGGAWIVAPSAHQRGDFYTCESHDISTGDIRGSEDSIFIPLKLAEVCVRDIEWDVDLDAVFMSDPPMPKTPNAPTIIDPGDAPQVTLVSTSDIVGDTREIPMVFYVDQNDYKLRKRIEQLEQTILKLQERVCTLEEDERKEWDLLWKPAELGISPDSADY